MPPESMDDEGPLTWTEDLLYRNGGEKGIGRVALPAAGGGRYMKSLSWGARH